MTFDDKGIVYEEFDVVKINKGKNAIMTKVMRKVIAEVSLKIVVNGIELVSMLCLNKFQEELALGFLYNEGVINSLEDVGNITYNESLRAVIIELREGIVIDRKESLRSITSGCGKCYTCINSFKQMQYAVNMNKTVFSVKDILIIMKRFIEQSELYKEIGGVHSILFYSNGFEIQYDDIGRHNCLDKITGKLMKLNKMGLTATGMIFISGRLSSEMITKLIRLGVPVVVSKTTPTTAAIRLARKYNVTLLGYVKNDKGIIYSCPERIKK
jgi:FdhD protein